MNTKILIGLAVGLGAYYFLMSKGVKKCNCADTKVEPKD